MGGFGIAFLASHGVDYGGVFGDIFGREGFGGETAGYASLAFLYFGSFVLFRLGYFGAYLDRVGVGGCRGEGEWEI